MGLSIRVDFRTVILRKGLYAKKVPFQLKWYFFSVYTYFLLGFGLRIKEKRCRCRQVAEPCQKVKNEAGKIHLDP